MAHPVAQPLTVNVKVDPTSTVHHLIPEDMQELVGDEIRKIRLLDATVISIPHGTHISHGNNDYIVVEHFVSDDEMKTLPNTNDRVIKEIPTGAKIIDSTGLPVTISASIKVDIPAGSKIRLPAGTKLQQFDGNIKLKVEEETVVRLD
jgi:hypothetical protein